MKRLAGFRGPWLLALASCFSLVALLLAWWLPFGVTLLLVVIGLGLLARWEATR